VLWLRYVTVVVRDYEAALAFYAGVLGYEVDGTRLTPRDGGGAGLLLVTGDANARGTLRLCAETDDLDQEHARLIARGVRFVAGPHDDERGRIAVFEDPDGNRIELVEPARP
jgi:catechol 2,3-dioxygenase-like lactoylglutathione lyase family enzyme